jgi:peptide/nickel transport system substrate-binding protein
MQFRSLATRVIAISILISILAACQDNGTTDPTEVGEPTLAPVATSTADDQDQQEGEIEFITIATDAPSRFRDFADIDEFGNVIGFDPDVIADIAADAGFEYEFVVTSYAGLLATVANGEFDAAMSALITPDEAQEGLAYTDPYLEVGQVLVVRANEFELQSHNDIRPGMQIGVQWFASGEETAREVLDLAEPDLKLFNNTPDALQALINGDVQGVLIDSDDADHFTTSYPQQLKTAGEPGRSGWITTKSYGIAVPEDNNQLLSLFNDAILLAQSDGTVDRLIRAWLIPTETIAAGESLVGTPANEIVIGIAGQLNNLDPAERETDLVNWEIHANTMSGLLMYDAENNLLPILAEELPTISEDGLEYTFLLRSGLTFPDNSELAASDVKYSINRAAGLGNFQINHFLKDANDDGFADDDAIQVLDSMTIKLVLKEPTSYFPSLLATSPYFVISEECYTTNPDPGSSCGGIGAYTILEWVPGEQMRLKANPEWPGAAPSFENIQIRFYDDPGRMRRSLENGAIDVAWTGINGSDIADLREDPGFNYWQGPSTFKSYLVIEQGEAPWSDPRIREAIAMAVDREALASEVFGGSRIPLYSPVPDNTPGHLPTEPERDLVSARSILTAAGYTPDNKLEMDIWYVNDGRYTILEEDYATALKEQLEETGLIDVNLQGAPWSIFRPESLVCNYPSFLLGWPGSGQPPTYLEAMYWIEYFITDTDSVCSNYESQQMDDLLAAALEETDSTARAEIYQQIQQLWAQDFPTLDLTQEPRAAISLPSVQNLAFDAMGLLRYDSLTKSGG